MGTLVNTKLSLFLILGHYVFNTKNANNVNKKALIKTVVVCRMLTLQLIFLNDTH